LGEGSFVGDCGVVISHIQKGRSNYFGSRTFVADRRTVAFHIQIGLSRPIPDSHRASPETPEHTIFQLLSDGLRRAFHFRWLVGSA
jgi:hypothetical protein